MRRLTRYQLTVVALAVVSVLVFAAAAAAHPSEHPFEVVPGSFHVTVSSDRAGAHADLTTSFDFAHEEGQSSQTNTYNDLRTVVTNLPPGLIGSNTAVPTCTDEQLLLPAGETGSLAQCPIASQVGLISFELSAQPNPGLPPAHYTVPLYNMEVTSPGIAAEFGFKTVVFDQIFQVRVRPGDSGLTATVPNITQVEPRNISVTVWGVPAAHENDPQRGETCGEQDEVPAQCHNELGGPQEAHVPIRPYLSNPTSCGTHIASMEADSYEHSETWTPLQQTEVGPITECDRVPFDPSIEAHPTTNTAESPSGLDVSLVVPQNWEEPDAISTSNLDDTTLTLPVGYTINPSAGSGLGVCTPAQYEAETYDSLPGEGCPQEAKIGTVEIETPVLTEKLTGNVYVAKPYENPFDSLLGLYIVVKDPARGIIVKLAGHIEPNPVTGQLVTRFDENPQVPFSKFTLKLRQGATSPLVSPPACGTYTAEADFTPWSAPMTVFPLATSFQIEDGIGGGACPTGGVPPFKPGLTAGTLNNSAGSYTPMDIHITRQDGEQEITGFSSLLPPGLTANLSGVPFCSEADIALARVKSGAQEEIEPACPAASEIGHTLVGAGVGAVLAYTPGKVYLAGPFEGAPFSIAAITSAKVGPFDLGTVVVHLPLFINPETAAVSIPSGAADQIPHIIDGIVIHVRDIRVYIERNNFMINPTNCNPLNFAATVIGGGIDPTNPADNTPVTTNDSFQLANCQNLQFRPKFQVSTSGKTSKADGASLTAKLVYPVAAQGTQADIKEVKVDLPKQLPSRLTTLQKACTAAQFNANPAGCPVASEIGHAKAVTPILPVPLEGPVYFVSHGGEAFPSLEVVLKGYGVTIDLVASTFISKSGITSSTFHTVPDQPVTSFELTLHNGPYSALAANGNLCTSKLAMPTAFVAQNGSEIHESTPIGVSGCPKKKALTRAQKLAVALKACHKRAKAKRAACVRTARKRFGPAQKKR